jgi:hypothetical protein
MGGLVLFLVILAAMAIFDVLAQTHGVDSRYDSQDPHAPAHGIYS